MQDFDKRIKDFLGIEIITGLLFKYRSSRFLHPGKLLHFKNAESFFLSMPTTFLQACKIQSHFLNKAQQDGNFLSYLFLCFEFCLPDKQAPADVY